MSLIGSFYSMRVRNERKKRERKTAKATIKRESARMKHQDIIKLYTVCAFISLTIFLENVNVL